MTTVAMERAAPWLDLMNAGNEQPEPIGRYQHFAHLVRELMGSMSSRVAARKTGVNHNTIANMRNGDRASMESIIQFANGFNANPNPLLVAAGFPQIKWQAVMPPDFRDDLERIYGADEDQKDAESERTQGIQRGRADVIRDAPEITYAPDEDRQLIIDAYEGANPVERRLMVDLAELIRRAERETAIGGRIAQSEEEGEDSQGA